MLENLINPKPPQGLIFNPKIDKNIKIRYETSGSPIRRCIVGAIPQFQGVKNARYKEEKRKLKSKKLSN
jgi:hypothetical protein